MADERISVSRDALRAELKDLELRLVKSLATKAELEAVARAARDAIEAVAQRVTALERQDAPTGDEFERVKAWQARMAGALAVVTAVAAAALPIVIQHYFH